jgi:hypothetical protein
VAYSGPIPAACPLIYIYMSWADKREFLPARLAEKYSFSAWKSRLCHSVLN